jgi:hypothetical protein
MKNQFSTSIILCITLAVSFTSCSKKTDPGAELQNAANLLEKADPATAPEAQAPQPASATTPAPSPAQQMNQAVAAYKSGNLEEAVTRLQTVRATPVMSPQQRMAVNDAMAAVMSDIYARAAKGDSGAMRAVKQYEEMQTHSH